MRQKSGPEKPSAEDAIRDIRRATRRRFSAEEKIRIVLEGLRGEESIAELCRREGIASSMYYGWSKEFLEAGKRRLVGDTATDCQATRLCIGPIFSTTLPYGPFQVGREPCRFSRRRRAAPHCRV
jgi:transposase